MSEKKRTQKYKLKDKKIDLLFKASRVVIIQNCFDIAMRNFSPGLKKGNQVIEPRNFS